MAHCHARVGLVQRLSHLFLGLKTHPGTYKGARPFLCLTANAGRIRAWAICVLFSLLPCIVTVRQVSMSILSCFTVGFVSLGGVGAVNGFLDKALGTPRENVCRPGLPCHKLGLSHVTT